MRLADQIIVAAGAGLDGGMSGAISSLGADIARAECFELSDDVREACYQVADSKPSSILSAMPMMRLPYARTSIEWTTPPDDIFSMPSNNPSETCTRRVRMGCLFEARTGSITGACML